jgi:hypothetical protein
MFNWFYGFEIFLVDWQSQLMLSAAYCNQMSYEIHNKGL